MTGIITNTAKKRILLSGLTGVWEAICKYWQVDMGVKSFKEVGLHAEGGALICDPKRILKKFNIDEHHKGDKHRNMSAADSFEQECGHLWMLLSHTKVSEIINSTKVLI